MNFFYGDPLRPKGWRVEAFRFRLTRIIFARKSCFLLSTSRQEFDCPTVPGSTHFPLHQHEQFDPPWFQVGNRECIRAVHLPTVSTYLPPRNSSNILSGITRPVHEDHPFDWLATKVHSARQTVLVLLPRCHWNQAKISQNHSRNTSQRIVS